MKILVNASGTILVLLRNCQSTLNKPAEIILDLSPQGHWIRGFEMVGGLFDFSLSHAVKPFRANPVRLGEFSPKEQLHVTYDPEADAAYFYLPYGARFRGLSLIEREECTRYSHSINPTAICALDDSGGLVSVLVPTADAIGPLETFLYLFDVEQQPAAG